MSHSVLTKSILDNGSLPIETIRKLERGLIFNKIENKGRSERRFFSIQLDLSRIVWISGRDEIEGIINLRDIKQIRIGIDLKSFDKWNEETKKCSADQIFTILYGRTFTLKELTCSANTAAETNLWVDGIGYLKEETIKAPYHAHIDIMLRREFSEINKVGSSNQPNHKVVILKDMKTFVNKIHCKLSTEQLKKHFHEVDKAFARQLDYEGFSTFFLNLMHSDNKILNENLNSYTTDGKRITLNEFKRFLKDEQKDQMHLNDKKVAQFMIDYLIDPMRHYEIDPYFTLTEFIDFLFSKQNGVWDTKYDEVYQDMSQPLTHYFIATSHNTYLSGDQFKSESSVECYARSLRMGCRCIELDCWDGPDGKPLIYHGRTLTSKIRFIDVILTIKEHAFSTSEFAVILSIENHCSVKQQLYMAEKFVEVFGDSLLTHQIDPNEQTLPSPLQLKRKIILKHKKLQKSGEDKPLNSPKLDDTTTEFDLDISNSIKNGILYLEDPIEKKWKSHYFMLTREKLYYVEPKVEDEDEDEDDNLYGYRNNNRESYLYQDNVYELHCGEMWFHGKLKGGRAEAELLLRRHAHIGDGTFLVRESETHTGDYSLSFLYQNEVHHSRINVIKSEDGHKTYSLNDYVSFASLYELMTHYQTHPLRSQKFKELYLKSPVPQPNSHEDKIWFYKNMTRAEAEDMLRRLRNDGAFLVRPSEKSKTQDENLFAISFRAENKIKHCRIKREGRLFVIGSAEFESLSELIDHYEKHPLYRKVKLKFPATEENVRILGGEPLDLETQCNYMDPKISSTKVVACYDYQAKGEQELSFSVGDIITNVVKQDHGWWKGDFNGNIGWYFPSNFVQEIEEQELQSFEKQKFLGDLKHGFIELDSNNLIIIPNLQNRGRDWVFRLGTLEISAQSEDEMKEWINKIQEAIQMNKSKLRNSKEVKQNLKIAPELNNLIVYCSAVPFNGCSTHFTEMSSFHEIKIEKLISSQNFRNILKYNEKQLSRVYPKGTRLDSSNYDPIKMWNCGVQMVALNYQTPDKPMQLNEAMFMQNGKCGYVLKPKYMFNDNFNPYEKPATIEGGEPLTLTVRIIAARNLKKAIRGIVSPSIELEIVGVDYDARKCLTRVINDNGLNPNWSSETFVFSITCPELAFIRFLVSHRDTFDDSSFVGQTTYPVTCLRQGFRSVQLKNEYSEELELATLLIHIDIRTAKDDDVEKLYASISMLKQSSEHLSKMIDEAEKGEDAEEFQRLTKLKQKIDEQLKYKNDEKRFVKFALLNKNDFKALTALSISNGRKE